MVAKAVKVTRKGQITLPVELRKEFGIEEGDVVYVRKGPHGIEIVTPEDWVSRTAGMFRDYPGERPLQWHHDQIWTQLARERYESILTDDPAAITQPPTAPNDHD